MEYILKALENTLREQNFTIEYLRGEIERLTEENNELHKDLEKAGKNNGN